MQAILYIYNYHLVIFLAYSIKMQSPQLSHRRSIHWQLLLITQRSFSRSLHHQPSIRYTIHFQLQSTHMPIAVVHSGLGTFLAWPLRPEEHSALVLRTDHLHLELGQTVSAEVTHWIAQIEAFLLDRFAK